MTKLTQEEIKALVDRAIEYRLAAYAPYSKFKVGAALLLDDNKINYDHKKGEFAKLVLVLYNAKEYAGTKEVDSEKPTLNQDNILDSVVNMDKDACIVDSLILYATMSNELMNLNNLNSFRLNLKKRGIMKIND